MELGENDHILRDRDRKGNAKNIDQVLLLLCSGTRRRQRSLVSAAVVRSTSYFDEETVRVSIKVRNGSHLEEGVTSLRAPVLDKESQ